MLKVQIELFYQYQFVLTRKYSVCLCNRLRNSCTLNKKATIVDIANALNTSAATVSRALNDNPRISDKTKKLVNDTAKSLGYEPNPVAAALRNGKSNTIGVIVPYIDRSFFSSVIRGIEEEVKKHGCNVMICQSLEDRTAEAESIDILIRARVAGIALSMASNDESHLDQITKNNIPLVTFDRVADDLSPHSVLADDFEGSYLVTKHMIEQGYKRIAHLAGDQEINIYRNRLRGYRAALEENNIVADNDLIIPTNSKVEEGRASAQKLLVLGNPPDAITSASDFSALGALQYCKSKGIKVSEEIGIAGFANEPFTEYTEPSLTSVSQKTLEMGKMVGQVLFDQNNEDQSSTETKKILLKPELIIRESSLRK
ncbi:MAG: LacI family DNA-binding transcriptional regulator [Cyclobacteriaceae bacterium]